mgnify:CR=1 FL=1
MIERIEEKIEKLNKIRQKFATLYFLYMILLFVSVQTNNLTDYF